MKKIIKGLPAIIPLKDYLVPKNIIVIGCGGTGGHLIPNLARFIGVIKSALPMNLILADGDVVENKNLTRQNFVTGDLGRNKAAVMASRYSRAFGFAITAITKDIEKISDIYEACSEIYYEPTLIIGCVDNNASRKVINEWFVSDGGDRRGRFWIDSGNEETTGQVVCGFSGQSQTQSICTPNVFEVFPEMIVDDAKFNSELSCADRAQSAPQNMQTNVTAATIIMNYVQKIMRRQIINSHGVDFSIENVYSTRLNTKENLSKVSKNRRKNWEVHYE
jgi:PRTRC genetic system ThiF family protein